MKTMLLPYIMKVNPMKIMKIIIIFTHNLDDDHNDDDQYMSNKEKKQW